MGGERARQYWSMEMKSVLAKYRQFETLIPNSSGKGAAHKGEDGRYVESILKDALQKFLPSGVEILTGFILRSGVKSDLSGKQRKKDEDKHSSQLDIIVYDSEHYPVYQRFGDTAVVLPEGVIAVISVKKTLYRNEIQHELEMLCDAAKLCAFRNRKGPFLALVSMQGEPNVSEEKYFQKVHQEIEAVVKYLKHPVCYDSIVSFVGILEQWTIHKINRSECKEMEFQSYIHDKDEEHLGIQFLLAGILDAYYGINGGKKPGYISYSAGKQYTGEALRISYDKLESERLEGKKQECKR